MKFSIMKFSPVTPFLIGLYILLIILFSNTLNVCFFSASDQVSRHTKEQVKLNFLCSTLPYYTSRFKT